MLFICYYKRNTHFTHTVTVLIAQYKLLSWIDANCPCNYIHWRCDILSGWVLYISFEYISAVIFSVLMNMHNTNAFFNICICLCTLKVCLVLFYLYFVHLERSTPSYLQTPLSYCFMMLCTMLYNRTMLP